MGRAFLAVSEGLRWMDERHAKGRKKESYLRFEGRHKLIF